MNGPTPTNAELANFFRFHTKNRKLSKEEFIHVESMLFSREILTTPSLPLFPRATPTSASASFSREHKLSSSKLSDFKQKNSRKNLDIIESGTENSNPLFASVFGQIESLSGFLDLKKDISADDSAKLKEIDSKKIDEINTPRKMTDAAKELMASIQMNFDKSAEEQEDEEMIQKTNHQALQNNFEFSVSKKPLPEFQFNIFETEPKSSVSIPDHKFKNADHKFFFDLSVFKVEKSPYPSSNEALPQYTFKLD